MGLLGKSAPVAAVVVAALIASSGGGASAAPVRPVAQAARAAGSGAVLTKHQALRLLAAKDHGSIGGLRYTTRSSGEYWLPVRDFIPAAAAQVPAGILPASCAGTGMPAVLLRGDGHVKRSALYRVAGATFDGAISPVQTVRYFRSVAAAQASYEQYRSALSDCAQLVLPGSPAQRIDRHYGPGPIADSFRTTVTLSVDGSSRGQRQVHYTARVGNTVVAFWGLDARKRTTAVLKALVRNAQSRARSDG